mmetsp:Transcript_2160/g.9832  ORF Transcript_2160/g.9832 Transcript_2160/m.9832 type:complete len:218 (-) Transcript_2160:456-1109(-)
MDPPLCSEFVAPDRSGRLPRISAISALTSSVGGARGGGATELSATAATAASAATAATSGATIGAATIIGAMIVAVSADGRTGPPSTGRMVPRRANQSPHALHSERTPLGPRRMSGVAWLVHPQLEHARPPFLALPDRVGAGGIGAGNWGRTGDTSCSTRRASSSAMHRVASLTFEAPAFGVETRRLPSPSDPHLAKCAPRSSTQTSSGSLKRKPSAR